MCFNKLIKNIFAVAFMLFTVFSVLATSMPQDSDHPKAGSHYIISDCVTPVAEATVVVTNSAITSPGGVSFLDFGFPTATLSQSVSGLVGGVTRECTVTYGEEGLNHVEDRWLYSCFEGGRFKCSIFIEPK